MTDEERDLFGEKVAAGVAKLKRYDEQRRFSGGYRRPWDTTMIDIFDKNATGSDYDDLFGVDDYEW